jgi:hypothetical protein
MQAQPLRYRRCWRRSGRHGRRPCGSRGRLACRVHRRQSRRARMAAPRHCCRNRSICCRVSASGTPCALHPRRCAPCGFSMAPAGCFALRRSRFIPPKSTLTHSATIFPISRCLTRFMPPPPLNPASTGSKLRLPPPNRTKTVVTLSLRWNRTPRRCCAGRRWPQLDPARRDRNQGQDLVLSTIRPGDEFQPPLRAMAMFRPNFTPNRARSRKCPCPATAPVWSGQSSLIRSMRFWPCRRAELNAEVERRMHSILGAVEVENDSGLAAFKPDCQRFGAGRTMLVGETGHAFPPIGAQGLNLGLRDIMQADRCARGCGRPGSGAARRESYNRQARLDVTSRTAGVDLLNRAC